MCSVSQKDMTEMVDRWWLRYCSRFVGGVISEVKWSVRIEGSQHSEVILFPIKIVYLMLDHHGLTV